MPSRECPTQDASPFVDLSTTATLPGLVADNYRIAEEHLERGETATAARLYESLLGANVPNQTRALAANDLGTLAAIAGELDMARARFSAAITSDPECQPARLNLAILDADSSPASNDDSVRSAETVEVDRPVRVAILSMLFNWPSTGGGIVHTAETGIFLSRAGYAVRHIYAEFPEWSLGRVEGSLPVDLHPLRFDPQSWNAAEIQRRFRQAVDEFAPDFIIITDSWNSKPLLAEAMRGYRYFLRMAALECLCPLNNVRLLVGGEGQVSSCPRHQLAVAHVCRSCVKENQHRSGSLHEAERGLAGFGTVQHDARLITAFAEAEAVLVVNPLIAAMVSPYAKHVRVVPSGFDSSRFPWPPVPGQRKKDGRTRLFFAGLVHEYIKGFAVLHEACQMLWDRRQDFELVATGDPPGQVDSFTRFVGWQSQAELPAELHRADILVFPTVAEEALGRSAVEAMAAGLPVIASRIGGLQFTVGDGATGLLFEPGNAADLSRKIEILLDDPALRKRMGEAGRRRFEEDFTWESIIDRHYRHLIGEPRVAKAKEAKQSRRQ